ncbi:hypothetical protein [Mariniflexile sp. HMF6888]|uniref:hypothetical protein n=1 Tax=Mariniflexile sp. HMF6888 TaxID=3373086 RepID=UPI0037AB90A4
MQKLSNILSRKKTVGFVFTFLLISAPIRSQEIINLYTSEIPNSKTSNIKESGEGMYRNITVPTLEYFKPNADKASGAAVIIIPEGSYNVVVYQGEGINNAKPLAKQGINYVYYDSPQTVHEWLTWRRDLKEFTSRLFK